MKLKPRKLSKKKLKQIELLAKEVKELQKRPNFKKEIREIYKLFG